MCDQNRRGIRRSRQDGGERRLGGFNAGAVHLHRDTTTKEVDRDHQQAFVGVFPDQHPLDIGQRAADDPHPLAVPKVGVGKDREASPKDLPNGTDITVGDDVQPIPPLTEDANETPRLADFQVAGLVDRVAEEDIPSEQRNTRDEPDPTAPAPGIDGRQKHLEPQTREPVMNQLFAIALGPQHMPTDVRGDTARWPLITRFVLNDINGRFCQGFAPLGPSSSCKPRPTDQPRRHDQPSRGGPPTVTDQIVFGGRRTLSSLRRTIVLLFGRLRTSGPSAARHAMFLPTGPSKNGAGRYGSPWPLRPTRFIL